jgi:nitrogen fixation NifU-like protein
MDSKNSYFSQADLQFYAKNPCNFGLIPHLDFVSDQHNPSCGDLVTIGAQVEKGMIKKLCFTGSGCVISMAMASKLTLVAVGMDFEQIRTLDEQFVQQLLGLQLGINRMQCGMLSVSALQRGLEKFEKEDMQFDV